ncbi:hypothetical protein DY000_02055232 [Brassica cretica]|uniref:Uncharacterized protein n=1 Tax=Brassica cretica TaxID=69181 RepID=A0ABQ7AJZ3_BRACR|nr:hypothetical protein DY000_02055232 [Brassica cretica]
METLSGNEEETEPEKQRDSYCSFCHGVRELQEQNGELDVETAITGILATESDITRCELGKDERIYW